MSSPRVSVIVVTFNRAWILRDAIESVLTQTFTDFELIVVDDGSEDSTRDLVCSFTDGRVRYVRQDHRGISAARNNGIAHARGGLIAFLDSDDIWYPAKLAKQVAFMERAGVDLCHTARHEHVYATGEDWGLRPVNPALSSEDFLRGDTHISMTVMVRKEIFDRAGLFDESFPVTNDMEMWLRVALKGTIGFLDEPLMDNRIHDSNVSRTRMIRKNGTRARVARTMLANDDPRINRKIWKRYLAKHLYVLACDLWDAGDVRGCRSNLLEAVRNCVFVGLLAAYPKDSAWMKFKKLLNPVNLFVKTRGRSVPLKEVAA